MMNWTNDYYSCDCKKIMEDLLNFTREIISDMSEQQRKKCEAFIDNCSCQNSQAVAITEGIRSVPCSHQICSMMLYRQSFLKREEMPLSTWLINIISYIYQKKGSHLDKDISEAAVMKGSFEWGDCHEINRILYALQGRSDIMKILLKLNLISSSKDLGLIEGTRKNLHHIIKNMNAGRRNYSVENVVNWTMESVRKVFYQNYFGRYERMYLATLAIQATEFKLKEEENMANEYIHCLRLYFVAKRAPLITLNEIRSMLYACLCLLDKLDLFDLYYDECVKLMPECPGKVEPRKLTDLVRCEIRQNLKKCNLPMTKAVENLNLPPPLKSFVLGNVINLTPKNENVSDKQVITMSLLDELLFETLRFFKTRLIHGIYFM